MTNHEWRGLSDLTRTLIGLDLHRCLECVSWVSDEETTFLDV